MQQTARQAKQLVRVEGSALSQRIKEISERVKIIRFGVVYETKRSPWDKLAGMFTVSRPVDIEEMLDVRGFEETANAL